MVWSAVIPVAKETRPACCRYARAVLLAMRQQLVRASLRRADGSCCCGGCAALLPSTTGIKQPCAPAWCHPSDHDGRRRRQQPENGSRRQEVRRVAQGALCRWPARCRQATAQHSNELGCRLDCALKSSPMPFGAGALELAPGSQPPFQLNQQILHWQRHPTWGDDLSVHDWVSCAAMRVPHVMAAAAAGGRRRTTCSSRAARAGCSHACSGCPCCPFTRRWGPNGEEGQHQVIDKNGMAAGKLGSVGRAGQPSAGHPYECMHSLAQRQGQWQGPGCCMNREAALAHAL